MTIAGWRPLDVGPSRFSGGSKKIACCPDNTLKTHKTTKELFGKVWGGAHEIWSGAQNIWKKFGNSKFKIVTRASRAAGHGCAPTTPSG